MTELEKMRAGQPYRPGDPELVTMRKRAQRLLRDYNHTVYGDDALRSPDELYNDQGTYTYSRCFQDSSTCRFGCSTRSASEAA